MSLAETTPAMPHGKTAKIVTVFAGNPVPPEEGKWSWCWKITVTETDGVGVTVQDMMKKICCSRTLYSAIHAKDREFSVLWLNQDHLQASSSANDSSGYPR